MTANTTLRQLAGMADQPATMADSTLILIDCQNTYTRGVLELDGVQAALDQAAELLDRARSARIPIFHVAHDGGAGSPYDVRADIGRIVDRVAPARGGTRHREGVSERLHRHQPGRAAERRTRTGPDPGRLHDPHVRELHSQGRVQPRLPTGGRWRGPPLPGRYPGPTTSRSRRLPSRPRAWPRSAICSASSSPPPAPSPADPLRAPHATSADPVDGGGVALITSLRCDRGGRRRVRRCAWISSAWRASRTGAGGTLWTCREPPADSLTRVEQAYAAFGTPAQGPTTRARSRRCGGANGRRCPCGG